MFQFRRFPRCTYGFSTTYLDMNLSEFPHSEISGSKDVCSSPRLFAAYRVLLRLSVPRHSPCALSSLTNRKRALARSRCELCRLHKDLEIVIVTLHPFGCCSTIKIYASVSFQTQNLSVALLHLLSIHCSVFKVRSPAFLKPDLKVQFPGL